MMPLMMAFRKLCRTASNLCKCTFHFLTFLKSSWKMGRTCKYVYAYVYALYLLSHYPFKRGNKKRSPPMISMEFEETANEWKEKLLYQLSKVKQNRQ